MSILGWKSTFQYLCEGYLENSFVFFAPYMPPVWVRGSCPSLQNHTGLFESLPCPKISCLLMMTRFWFSTWAVLWLWFRYGRDMVLIRKWLCVCVWVVVVGGWDDTLLQLLNFTLWTLMSVPFYLIAQHRLATSLFFILEFGDIWRWAGLKMFFFLHSLRSH